MSTQYQVDILFGTRRADSAVAEMEAKLRRLDREARQAGGRDSFKGIADGAETATGKIGELVGAIRGAAAVAALVGAGRFVFMKTAELEAQTASIQTLTGSLEKANSIISQLQQYGAVTPFTSTQLIETARQLAAFGIETEKLVATTKRLGDISGATGAELEGLALAYGQVAAKGRLQGEELLQFTERGVALLPELQRMYGLTGEEMRKALEKGQVSAEAVEVAIIRLTEAGGKYAGGAISQSTTLSGKLSTLQDNIDGLARTIGTALSPAFKAWLDRAIWGVEQLNAALAAVKLTAFDVGDWVNEAMNFGDRFGLGAGYKAYEQRRRDVGQARAALLGEATGTGSGGLGDWSLKDAVRQRQQGARVPALLAPSTGAGSGKEKKGKEGPDHPAYITANQMRAWLKSQGYERTSGDFTNRGHRTPNHMLNAIDTGELDGPYPQAVQRAKALERRLRATGAFGGQLFGPLSDPGGHKDHVHIPTPGGRVKVTPALARLMGLGGKEGMAGDEAEWANKAEEDAARIAEAEADRTKQIERRLALSRAELAIEREQDPARRIALEGEKERLQIRQDVADLREADVTGANAERIKTVEALALEIQKTTELAKQDALLKQQRQTREDALRPLKEEIEMLEAAYRGPAAVKALERQRTIDGLGKAGVGAAEAGSLVDRRDALLEQADAKQKQLEKLEAAAESVSGAFGSLFRDMVSGTATAEEALQRLFQSIADSFTDMVAQMIQEWIKAQIMGIFTGGAGAPAAAGGGGGFGIAGQLVGGLFSGAGPASFAGGGYTGSGSRAGGVDGRGGFPAILHPNETVIDHSAGQGLGGGQVVNVGGISVSVASDGSSKVDAGSGGELARGIQAAVTAEILRQKRPGGALAGGR
jgi:tape measure domain-containing protein